MLDPIARDPQRNPAALAAAESVTGKASRAEALAGDAGLALAPDAAIVLGIASTAMPFAGSRDAEAARWLRVLRLHGEAGAALQALGVSEMPLLSQKQQAGDSQRREQTGESERDSVRDVSKHAVLVARERAANAVNTTDVLMGVMHVYGAEFDRVLRAHGTDRDEVIEQLSARRQRTAKA